MAVIYEIHKYQNDDFQYVVASTNRYTESKVKNDVERMNSMLNETLRTSGIRYVFVIQILLILHIKNEKRRVLRLEYGRRRMRWSIRPDNKLDGPITTFR